MNSQSIRLAGLAVLGLACTLGSASVRAQYGPVDVVLNDEIQTFDVVNETTGLATSIKSLDAHASSYTGRPGSITSSVGEYVDATRTFTRDGVSSQTTLRASDFRRREVLLVLPQLLTRAQCAEVKAAQQAASSGNPPVTVSTRTRRW